MSLIQTILEAAVDREATEIHFEPGDGHYSVRFRIDGLIQCIPSIPDYYGGDAASEIKGLARLDTSETQRIQEARIVVKCREKQCQLLVKTLPICGNREKVLIHLYQPLAVEAGLEVLGMTEIDMGMLQLLTQNAHGLILVCGPHESGKTTTLYTLLRHLNDGSRNIFTMENPIEQLLKGVSQTQYSISREIPREKVLEQLLRYAPDTVMIGEIMDGETLAMALQVALSGRLVLSSVSSHSTAGAFRQLVSMGASPQLLNTALCGIISQRLIRKLCMDCKQKYPATLEEKQFLLPGDTGSHESYIPLFESAGCEQCNNTGFKGRTGIFEILFDKRTIRERVADDGPEIDGGLGYQARLKVLEEMTTIPEIVRVLGTAYF